MDHLRVSCGSVGGGVFMESAILVVTEYTVTVDELGSGGIENINLIFTHHWSCFVY